MMSRTTSPRSVGMRRLATPSTSWPAGRASPDTTRGFTSDMFVPVYPFTHPEHQSVRPERVLPFPDCAHWLDSMVDVAVQRVSEGLDNSKACELPPIQIPLIERAYAKQWTRFAASERRKNLTAKSRSAPPASCGPSDSSPTHDASSAPNAPRPGGPEALEGDPYTNEFVPLVNVGVEIDQRFAGLDTAAPDRVRFLPGV
ncbi:hypothetical protein LXA43DRAFT_447188 [Ganoderma leucocontextum]|nr:hypothetical protein LXA43DRAFT_447188 [Ganoderma leucocontextum]